MCVYTGVCPDIMETSVVHMASMEETALPSARPIVKNAHQTSAARNVKLATLEHHVLNNVLRVVKIKNVGKRMGNVYPDTTVSQVIRGHSAV